MKNRLLPLLFVLGSYSAYSQVGIGKLNPDASAQLEVFATDKGMLIPRVALTGSTDQTTITNGNKESLLVYNTVTVLDIKPGYYYWSVSDKKWHRLAISDEVTGGIAGLAGGPGAPGDVGVTVPADAIAWIDTVTGYVYIKGTDGEWIKVSAKDGVDGAAGLAGGPGVPGLAGVTPPASTTTWIDTTTGIIYIYDPATKEWVKVSGNNGKDGIIGIKGDPGDAGVTIPAEATILVNDLGVVFIKDPNTGNWIKVSGNNGVDGAAGLAGGPGLPGDPGITVPADTTAWIDTTTGYVYVQDPVTKEWVKVNGKDGVDGAAGLAGGPGVPGLDGVTPPAGTTAWIDTKTGIVYIYDPATKEWVKVSGNNGKDGIIGIKGDPGDAGVTIPAEATILVNDLGVVFIKDPNTGNWIKVSGNNGVDGAAGLAGGPGLPGDPGITVPADTTAWIDTTTGYVYVQDPVTKEWVKVNGKDGVDGAAGLAGGPGVPGLDGVTPPAGTTAWIDTKTGIVYIYDPATKEWVKVSGNNGKDGIIGIKGDPGDAGVTIPAEATILVNDLGVVFIKDPNTGNWIKVSGNNGVDGAAGLAGGPGLPGDPGITVPADTTAWIDTTTGYVYVQDPVTKEWVKVNGKDGVDGAAGLAGGPGVPGLDGVTPPAGTTAWIDTKTGIVYIYDPATKEWVKVSGNNGKDGIIGIKGDPGDAGVTIPAEATILVNDLGVVFIKDPNTGNWIKVSGNNGVDGAAGLAGGPGLPGDPGITVPADTTAWIDTTTGYVYVQDPVTKEWVKVNGKDGVDGAAGLAGGPGVPGLDGVTPPAGTTAWIDTKTGIVYIYDPATKEWVKVSGNNGKDGIIGIKGDPGDAGVTIPAEATILVNDLGVVFIKDPNTGNWIKVSGNNGVDGAAGLAGGPGLPGDPGITVPAGTTAWVDTTTGYIYVQDPITKEWVKVSGKDGVDGAAGLAGGPGVPGLNGVTPPASTTTWIDTTSGIVYIKDADGNWVKVSGNDGKDGKSFTYADFTDEELAGLKGNPGVDGVTSFVPTVTAGHDIATFTDAAGNPAAIKETITSLEDVVTEETDVRGQVFETHTLTYTNETGAKNAIDMSTLVKGVETLTSLAYDGSLGELSYKDEAGVTTSFNMVDMVGANQTLTKLVINSDDGTLDYTDENKATHPLDLADLVKEPWYGVDSKKGATLNTDNIYTQGWVGIGFTAPSDAPNEKLRVNGAITTVNSYYADYVFEDYFKGFSDIKADYKFKTLAEIDAYIKKNNHLPGITPINELMKTKEGYSFNVSELSIQLLEKTEELYLHIIEQDKELEAKNNEIEKLKMESKSLKVATDEMNARLEKLEKLMSNK